MPEGIINTGFIFTEHDTLRQRMNKMSAELQEQAELARQGDANLLADVLMMARSDIIEAESKLAGYAETMREDPKHYKTNGVY